MISINENVLRKITGQLFHNLTLQIDGLGKVKTNRFINEKLRFFLLLVFTEINESVVGEGGRGWGGENK